MRLATSVNALYFSHEYAVVGSALIDSSGEIAYAALGGTERIVDDEALSRLNDETRAFSRFDPRPVHGTGPIGGGKYLVLRNPHNRNRRWCEEQVQQQSEEASARRRHLSLHRLNSLTSANRTDWPERNVRDRRSNTGPTDQHPALSPL